MRPDRPTRSALLTIAALAVAFPLIGALIGAAPVAAQEEGVALGTTIEAFEIADLEGTPVDLTGVIGTKPVLVEFWATWCPVCRVLDPKIAAAHDQFADDVEFLVVAVGVGQRKEQIELHIRRHPVAGRLLWDARGAAARAFEAPGTGYVVILDASGRVAYTGTGTDQDIVGALERVTRR